MNVPTAFDELSCPDYRKVHIRGFVSIFPLTPIISFLELCFLQMTVSLNLLLNASELIGGTVLA